MEILQLKYFMETAKLENISHTAKKYRVPPSTVSVAIKKLEKELETKLFDRTANKLKLNGLGRIFLNALEKAEGELKKAKTEMVNHSLEPSGNIRFLVLTNRRLITDTIYKFRMEYPKISFSIRHEDYSDYAHYNNFDIIVSDREIDIEDFERSTFVYEEVFIGVHKNHPLSEMKSVNLKDLKNEKFISMPEGSSLRELTEKNFRRYNISPETVIECDDPFYICEYLKSGLGITFFPGISWKKQIDDNIRLLKVNEGLFRESFLYMNKNSSDAAKLFCMHLKN